MSQPLPADTVPAQRRPAAAAEIAAILSRFCCGTEALDDITETLHRLTLTAGQRHDITSRLNAMARNVTRARDALSGTAPVTA